MEELRIAEAHCTTLYYTHTLSHTTLYYTHTLSHTTLYYTHTLSQAEMEELRIAEAAVERKRAMGQGVVVKRSSKEE